MNSLEDIWNSVLEILGRDLTSIAITTWFSDCTPVEIKDNRLIIHTSSGFKREIIQNRFAEEIKASLSEIFSCEFDLEILAGDELSAYEISDEPEDAQGDDQSDNAGWRHEMASYTFDKFIVGSSNKFAHAAAIAVSENPGDSYNPLFIYGNSGLGKTHLLLSIGQAISSRDKNARIAYVKGDDFTNSMVKSIKENTQEEFRNKYRNVDLFLVDDIQFISGKIAIQEEFFHTFNTLFEAGHQIVITSDRPPIEMHKLEDRLRTRFEGGLMADVQPPDATTRTAIINKKAAQLGLVLSGEVTEFIAEHITSNIRQIEGVVKRLTAYASLEGDNISVASVKRAIKDVIRMGTYIPTPEIIIEETARYYSFTTDDLKGQRRSKNLAMARQISMYLCRTLTNISLKDIGQEFEDRNHSTVLSSVKKVETLVKTDPDVVATIRDITSNINSRN